MSLETKRLSIKEQQNICPECGTILGGSRKDDPQRIDFVIEEITGDKVTYSKCPIETCRWRWSPYPFGHPYHIRTMDWIYKANMRMVVNGERMDSANEIHNPKMDEIRARNGLPPAIRVVPDITIGYQEHDA